MATRTVDGVGLRAGRRRVGRWAAATTFAIVFAGCGAPVEERPLLPRPTSEPTATFTLPANGTPVSFEWEEVHGGKLASADLLDRVTVLAFVTTYDVPSQAEVRFLSQLAREHTPRLNVAIVVLEPPENTPLALAFASALDLRFPVAMADEATIKGDGPFAGLHHVPAIVVLDKRGVERFRHLGLVDSTGLEEAVREVETGKVTQSQ